MEGEKELLKAGKIASRCIKFSQKKAKDGLLLLDLAKDVDKKIEELGGKPAFPINLSLNEFAAHHAPVYNDKSMLKESDVLKVDLGVHVNGYIADTAVTINLDNEHEKLIKASENALNAALNIAKPGTALKDIGKAISEEIKKLGFKPIRNLSGHGVEKFNLHSGITIPNYDNGSDKKLEEGMVIAIEPFATQGAGLIAEYPYYEIFKLEHYKPTRLHKDVLDFINKNYRGLPFAKRWIADKFGHLKAELAVKSFVKNGLLHAYSALKDINNKLISQAEHTVVVKSEPIITTK